MSGTALLQMVKNGRNASGQLTNDKSFGGAEDFARRGRGTDGGSVVERKAAKYKHSAGPGNMRSVSTLRQKLQRRVSRTCDHQIALCASEHIRIQQMFHLCLCQSRLEVAVETVLDIFLREEHLRVGHGRKECRSKYGESTANGTLL